ncbi:hypothetical protein Psp6_00061 [Pseudomonas phage Psp6]|nr:hypothetical protein Psp6_00061 [Pseudomonas phage Psp6]
MSWVNHYLEHCVYVDGGRGPVHFDCWGLTRHVRAAHLGCRELPSYGDLRNTDPRQFTKAYRTEAANMEECQPEHGAIAAVIIGKVCMHVALVLELDPGELSILEINNGRPPRVLPLWLWRRDHVTVTYHRDLP